MQQILNGRLRDCLAWIICDLATPTGQANASIIAAGAQMHTHKSKHACGSVNLELK